MLTLLRKLFRKDVLFVNSESVDIVKLKADLGNSYTVVPVQLSPGAYMSEVVVKF